MIFKRQVLIWSILPLVMAISAGASGRRNKEAEGFPDYNKLEYSQPIPKAPEPPAPVARPIPVKVAPIINPADDKPLPPKAVPTPRNTSEPDFPDEMLETISSTATKKAP